MNVWQFLVLNFTDIVLSPAQNVIFLTNMLGLMRGVLNYAILYELEWYQKRDNSRIYEIIPPPFKINYGLSTDLHIYATLLTS